MGCTDSDVLRLEYASFLALFRQYSIAMAAAGSVEDEVLSSIAMEQIYAVADQVVRYGGLILRMRFEENCSHREISRRLGITHQVVDRKMNSLLRYFRENANIFF